MKLDMADGEHVEGGGAPVGAMVRAGAAAGGLFSFSLAEGVSLSVKNQGGGGGGGGYDVEWRDVRCLPSSSDADVSRNATPRAFSESSGDFEGLVDLLQRIVFGGEPDVGKAPGSAQSNGSTRAVNGAAVRSPGGGETVLHLQKRGSRAEVQSVSVKTNIAGELIEAVWTRAAKEVQRDTSPAQLFLSLASLCASDEEGWALVRPAQWSELPNELWWHVLRWLTKREGAAVSCSCTNIHSIVTLDTFIWAPAQAPPPPPAFSSAHAFPAPPSPHVAPTPPPSSPSPRAGPDAPTPRFLPCLRRLRGLPPRLLLLT